MDSVNKESMDNLLEKVLNEHNLHESPGQIDNMDETGIPLDSRPPKVVTKYGEKKVRYRQSGNKEQMFVIGYRNAVGQAILPMVIFEGKYLWTVGEVPSTIYGMTDKRWTIQLIFFPLANTLFEV